MPDGLRARTTRILRHHDGKFDASPFKLLDAITDGNLVVASDTVEAIVQELPAQEERPSGHAQLRLLAWVLADARGAAPLEPDVAEKAGKRLQKQAERVRGALVNVAAAAAAAREEARAVATDGAAETQVAAINEDEVRALTALRAEVYVGFHEAVELPALVAPEPPAHFRARWDGCASIDEPATQALVLRALERNLDLEVESGIMRQEREREMRYYEDLRFKERLERCRVENEQEKLEERYQLELEGLQATLTESNEAIARLEAASKASSEARQVEILELSHTVTCERVPGTSEERAECMRLSGRVRALEEELGCLRRQLAAR